MRRIGSQRTAFPNTEGVLDRMAGQFWQRAGPVESTAAVCATSEVMQPGHTRGDCGENAQENRLVRKSTQSVLLANRDTSCNPAVNLVSRIKAVAVETLRVYCN